MNCPKCGREMKEGFIRASGRGGVCWVTDKKHKAPAADSGFEPIGKAKYLSPCFIKAYKCSDCKMLVADYSEC